MMLYHSSLTTSFVRSCRSKCRSFSEKPTSNHTTTTTTTTTATKQNRVLLLRSKGRMKMESMPDEIASSSINTTTKTKIKTKILFQQRWKEWKTQMTMMYDPYEGILPKSNVAAGFALGGLLLGWFIFFFSPKDIWYHAHTPFPSLYAIRRSDQRQSLSTTTTTTIINNTNNTNNINNINNKDINNNNNKNLEWYIKKNIPEGRIMVMALGILYGLIGHYWYRIQLYEPLSYLLKQQQKQKQQLLSSSSSSSLLERQYLTPFIQNLQTNYLHTNAFRKRFLAGSILCIGMTSVTIPILMIGCYKSMGHIFSNEYLDENLIKQIERNKNTNKNKNNEKEKEEEEIKEWYLDWDDRKKKYYFLNPGVMPRDPSQNNNEYSMMVSLQTIAALEIPIILSMGICVFLSLHRSRNNCQKICQRWISQQPPQRQRQPLSSSPLPKEKHI